MKRNIIRKNTSLNGISIERYIEIPDYDMTLLKLSTMTPYLEGRRVHKTLDHNKKENEDSVNDHEYVDLGLPSGTLWATMNVGASSETDYGNYYQYGKGAAQYAVTSGDSNYSGTEDPLDSSVDTAAQVWGGSWHMPTRAQMQELIANTTYEWTTINGVNGEKFTAANGNYVFFPGAGLWFNGSLGNAGTSGRYWGSTPNGSRNAYYLGFNSGYNAVSSSTREGGAPVRGVLDNPNLVVKYYVEDASHPTQLYGYYAEEGQEDYWTLGVNMFDKVLIDGIEVPVTELDATGGEYQLSAGEHTIIYTLKDPTFIGSEIDAETEMPTKIGATLSRCDAITSVTIPNSVTTIGDLAFNSCSGLTSVTIPNSVTSIGQYAFQECESLTSVNIPNSVTSIGTSAFQGCTNLTNVTIPNSITSIDGYVFAGCTSLTSIVIPNSVTSIGQSAFQGCSGLTNIAIPSSVISIGQDSFYGTPWWNTYSVDTANQYGSIIYINDVAYKAFSTSITGCEFREGTISIGSDAFGNCSRLTSVTIPDSVTLINGIAFYNCTSLIGIVVESTTPPTLDYRVFENTNDCPIYVPSESVDAYKAANGWSDYASRIQAIQDDGGETAVK